MNLYNTRTRKIEEIKPQDPSTVTVYTCGPTVYDYAHVGHWFNYVRMDTLIRTLAFSGLKTKWVMNITDVGHLVSDGDEGEDKLQKGANREGKSAWDIAEFYTEDFLTCMELLNITKPSFIVKATEHIPEQIELIKKLEDREFTYIIDDGVYYDTSKFPAYGDFAQLDTEEQQASDRITPNPQKRNPQDFALWKLSPKDSKRDMEWESPWGKGFPGWHIECSAMSMMYLGETLDIHTGGIDHIPVHHTNEIAQSEAITGKRFANHWMHGNHVMIDNEKISKSAGNGIRLQDVIIDGISPQALRLHVLESNYRTHSTFNTESLIAAQNRLNDLRAMAALRWQAPDSVRDTTTFTLEDVPKELFNLMAEDLNTPMALAYLSNVSTQLLAVHIERNMVDHFEMMLRGIDELLGLDLIYVHDINPAQKQLIRDRDSARSAKDWTEADRIRDELLDQKIELRDTDNGTIWSPL